VAGDEIEIVVECCTNRDGQQSSTSPNGWQAAQGSGPGDDVHVPQSDGQGLHGWPGHAPDPAVPHQRCPVVRFRKIEGDAISAAAKPGAWHRLQLTGKLRGGTNGSSATNQTLRFFAELGNGATARLLAGE
jgi:hypothetical protein